LDSLTQAVLGATVGEVVLGKKIGNKAPLWGAVAGTIPDLDVVLNFFVGEVQSTLWHRTFSHSLFVLTLAAPLFGYLVYLIYRRKSSATFSDWTMLFFWGLITHPLLDGCTNYGTMLLYPFSMERISWRTIFIIDPLYTLPLLIVTIAVLFMKKGSLRRRRTAIIGLAISSVYLITTFFIKAHVSNVVEASLEDQSISYQKFMTSPTFFNNILWSAVVKSEAGYHVGYYSLLDDDRQINFKYLPQNEALLQPFLQAANPEKQEQINDLVAFTEHFYAMEEAEQGIYLNDLRFGIMTGWFDLSQDFIFSFLIFKEADAVRVERAASEVQPSGEDFNRLLQRTLGK
jgi:inner membrane protein